MVQVSPFTCTMSGLNASGVEQTCRTASFLLAGRKASMFSGGFRAKSKGFVVVAEGISLSTTVVVPETPETNAVAEVRVRPEHVRPPADRVFRGLARSSGIAVLTLMTLI